jgi:DNA-binding XRE family transcriptional regulator
MCPGEVSVHLLTSHFTPLHIPPLCVAPPGHAEWRPLVKRYSYSERDYAFGQLMLTLRTTIGLTQASLGDLLGVSRRAVAEWEGGSNYPKVELLKQLIALGVLQQVFPAGREVEEIRALWFVAGACVPSC